jgi:hypothetical protein
MAAFSLVDPAMRTLFFYSIPEFAASTIEKRKFSRRGAIAPANGWLCSAATANRAWTDAYR